MCKSKTSFLNFFCLTFLGIVNVSRSGEITNCEFVDFNIYHVRLSCKEFNAVHEPLECFYAYFKNKYLKDKVQILETGDCRGNRLNSSLTDFFRSLHTYDIFYYGVEHLTAADLNFRNLRTLNASHNELVTIFEATFENTPKLAQIDYSFNKIMILEKDAFSRLGELELLNLKSNLIETIDENMFIHNKKLKELNLEENPLKRFDGNIFWPFINSASVRISSGHLMELDTSCLKESLKIEFQKKIATFSISEKGSKLNFPREIFKNLTYFNISGNHLQNTSKFIELMGSSVEILDLTGNFLGKPESKLPKSRGKTFEISQILQYFGNLSHLGLSNINLTNVTFNATNSKLKVLDLSKNQLDSLSFTGIFENLDKIDASYNDLMEIDSSILDSVPNVVEIILSHNKISTFAKETFSHLENLQVLDLSNNLIQSIDAKLFKNNKKLTKLRLKNNLIARIDCNMFDLLQSSLDVTEKKQRNEVVPNIFEEDWKNLTEIDLSCVKNTIKIDLNDANGIVFRRDDHFGFRCSRETLQNMKYFNISGLNVQNTPKLLQFLGSSLEKLDVSSNFIGYLDVTTFQKLTNLQILNLSRTNLSNFGFETFYHHRKLQALDLSYNQLKKLNFTLLFRNFKNLHTLNLEGNDLNEVDTVTKLIFPKLISLAISKNHFSCDHLATFLFQWHNLHLINNPSNQTNIDGVDCYHKGQGFDNGSHHHHAVTTNEPGKIQTPSATVDIEITSEEISTESENVEENFKNETNIPTETITLTKNDVSVNETNEEGTRNQQADTTNYYVLELRIVEFALVFLVLSAILIIVNLKCRKIKGKMRCNPRVRNRHDSRNSQHGIELIDHETFDD